MTRRNKTLLKMAVPLFDVDFPTIARAVRCGELNLDDLWLVVYVNADAPGDDEPDGDMDEGWAVIDALAALE